MEKRRLFVMFSLLLATVIGCRQNPEPSTNDQDTVPQKMVTETIEDQDLYMLSSQVQAEIPNTGTVILLSEEEFEAVITDMHNPKGYQYKGFKPCIIDFYADWCAPCHRMNPILMDLAKEYNGKVVFYKVNVEKSPNAAAVFSVLNLPTFILLKPNMQPVKAEGAQSKEEMKTMIEQVLFRSSDATDPRP